MTSEVLLPGLAEIKFPMVISPALIAEREWRQDELNLPRLFQMVLEWLLERPLMKWNDGHPELIAKLITGEIKEFVEELDVPSANKQQYIKACQEAVDIIFFAFSHQVANPRDLDWNRVHARINGQGDRSNLFDYLDFLADGVADPTDKKAIQELYIVWASAYIHLEGHISASAIMDSVLEKNSKNYPARYFGEIQSEVLKPDIFQHRVRCLRIVREALKLAGKQRPYGLQPADYMTYDGLILTGWMEPEQSIQKLIVDLAKTHQISARELTIREAGYQRVVAPVIIAEEGDEEGEGGGGVQDVQRQQKGENVIYLVERRGARRDKIAQAA